MYLTNASISALFRRIELFAALSGLFFAHNSLKINCFHHWDGLYLLPDVSLKPLEELFRARVITFLLDKGLLPPERARMLRGWVHSGFNVHRSRRVLPEQREDIERLAQYIIRLRRFALF